MTSPTNPPTEQDIAEVAKGLSEETLYAVLQCQGHMPAYALSSSYDGRRAVWLIKSSKLFEKVPVRGSQWWHYKLNELGLELRAHLLSEQTHAG